MHTGSKCGKALLVLALSLSLGAHWALLQTVAWTGMLISYSQVVGIAAGVSTTFDGKHPCPLCLIIKKARGAEEKPDSQNPESRVEVEKLIAVPAEITLASPNVAVFQHAASLCRPPVEWSVPPPKPPPRAALAPRALGIPHPVLVRTTKVEFSDPHVSGILTRLNRNRVEKTGNCERVSLLLCEPCSWCVAGGADHVSSPANLSSPTAKKPNAKTTG